MAGSVAEVIMGLLMAVYYAGEKFVKLFLPQAMFEKDINGQVTFCDYRILESDVRIRGGLGDGRRLGYPPPDVPQVRQTRRYCGHLGRQQDRQ